MLAAAALVLAACGAGSSGEPLSRAELTRQVNAVCTEIDRLGESPTQTGREDITAYFDRTLPLVRGQLDRFPAADRAPQEIARDYGLFMRARRNEVAALREVADTTKDIVKATAASQAVERSRDRGAELARTLRFQDCSR